MKQRLAWVPNMITMGNVFCGFLAILFVTRVHEDAHLPYYQIKSDPYYYKLAMIMMLVAGILDFFDGFIARKLGVSSEVGRELDSLADIVSFCVAPALLIYQRALVGTHWFGVIAVAVYVCCGAFRLARYNVLAAAGRGGTMGKRYFTGMPVEGGTAILIAFVLSSRHVQTNHLMIYAALASVLIAGAFMVSTIRFTADVPWFIRVGALVVMFMAFRYPGRWAISIPILYIVYALISNAIARRAEHRCAQEADRYHPTAMDDPAIIH